MADDIQYMTDAEIEATWGKGSAAKIREQDRLNRLAAQEAFVVENQPVPRRRGGKKSEVPEPPAAMQEFMPAPRNRSVGGTRGKYESPAEFAFRMNQGIPRGARAGGGGGLDQMLLMNEGGMGAEDARLKANILRSRGGRVTRGEDGSLSMQSATARNAPRSSTGRDYDPVAERRAILDNARAAVNERKNLQESDAILLRKQEEAARTPGTMRGFANKYGSGQAKTLTMDEFLKRPAAKITEGRHKPVTNDMREVIGWMNKDQAAAGMPSLDSARRLKESDAMTKAYDLKQKEYLESVGKQFREMVPSFGKVKPKMNGGEVNPGISTMITGEDGPELQFKREDGSLFVIPADITAKITAGLEMENSEDGKESLRAIKGGKVRPKMNGGSFGGQQNLNQAWVKEYRNALTATRGGVPMPGIESNMSPYEANLTASRGGVPMPGMLRPGGVLKRTVF